MHGVQKIQKLKIFVRGLSLFRLLRKQQAAFRDAITGFAAK